MREYKIKNGGWQVPSFSVEEFFPKKTKYCVCILVLNEGERIKKQLGRMKDFAEEADIIIADGGSKDNSLGHKLLRSTGVRALLVKTGPGKLSAQMRMALAYAIEEGYKGFIFMDGNNKDNPATITNFISELDNNYDHIQGSRFIKGGRAVNTPLSRYLAIRLIHAPLISLACGFRYTDTTNGFRAYSLRFIKDKRVDPFRDVFSEYELHYYLAIRAVQLKYKVKEIPVTRSYPKGKTPTKITPIRGYAKVLKMLIKACTNRYNPRK